MMVWRALVLIVMSLVAQPVVAQQSYSTYIKGGAEQGWWQRTINASPWLREQLGQSFAFGRSIAVVVGIGDYDYIHDLASPAADADRVTRFLIDEAGFDEVYTLKDDQVTFATLNRLMTVTLPRRVTGNDRFFFTGLGMAGAALISTGAPMDSCH